MKKYVVSINIKVSLDSYQKLKSLSSKENRKIAEYCSRVMEAYALGEMAREDYIKYGDSL